MTRDLQQKAGKAAAALRALIRSALAEAGEADPAKVDLSEYRFEWSPGASARELAAEALRLAARAASADAPFRNGCVYCYHCGRADCEHARPPGPGSVFAGYESTGRPRWNEFFNELLALGDPRTEQLFSEPPATLARLIGRRRLIADQLLSFGRNSYTYRVWGQIIAGYFHVSGLRAALSAQVVETRDHRLHLQLITPPEVFEALAGASPDRDSSLARIHDAVIEARNETFAASQLWSQVRDAAKKKALRDRVFGALRHLGHSIERKGRQHRRRTHHAEVRAAQQRPTHKARDDLAAARPEDFFRDTVRHTVVVRGRNNRLHAFSDQGRHITSLFVGRDEMDRRCRRKRYIPLEPEAIEALRRAGKSEPGETPAANQPRPEAFSEPAAGGKPPCAADSSPLS